MSILNTRGRPGVHRRLGSIAACTAGAALLTGGLVAVPQAAVAVESRSLHAAAQKAKTGETVVVTGKAAEEAAKAVPGANAKKGLVLVAANTKTATSTAPSTPKVTNPSAITPLAVQGTGFGNFIPGDATPWIGSMNVNGVEVYCIQPGVDLPVGNSVDNGVQTSVNGLSPLTVVRINATVTRYGSTHGNAIQAAAVHWVVKYLADPANTVHEFGNPGTTLDSAIDWQVNTQGGQANTDQIKTLTNQYLTEANRVGVPDEKPATGTVHATLQVDKASDFVGKLFLDDMTVTPGTGTITLKNGVFKSSGTSSITGTFKKGDSFDVLGKPPAGTGKGGYKIAVSGELTAGSTGSAPKAALHVFTTAGQQTTVSSGGVANQSTVMKFNAEDPQARLVPQMSSKAQELTSPYADTNDIVTVTGATNAFPVGGVDVVNTAYVLPGVKPSKDDAQYLVDARKLYTATKTVTKAGDVMFEIPDLAGKATDGTHIRWMHQMKNHVTGELLQQAAVDDPNEWTPSQDLDVHTTPPLKPEAGTAARDKITVNGYAPKDTTVVVTQYQVPHTEELVCSAENQIGTPLTPVPIKPGLNKDAIYWTQLTGALVEGHSGFVEQTFVKGKLIETSGCQDELFDVVKPDIPEKPKEPETPKTPDTPKPPKPTTPPAVKKVVPPAPKTTLPVVAG